MGKDSQGNIESLKRNGGNVNKLSIIIVNFNTPELVRNCLESIKKHLKIDYEVIIINNGDSKFNNYDFKEITTLNTSNKSFGAANNFGAKNASGEYILLLNPDTLLVDNSLQEMLEFIKQHKEIGAISPILYNDIECKRIQNSFWGTFQTIKTITVRRRGKEKVDFTKEYFYAETISAAALLVKKDKFEEIKGFDEKFFMYFEDDDLCKRLARAGYKNAVYTKAKIIHLEGKSIAQNKNRKRIYYKSQDYYWFKHNGFLQTMLMKALRFPYKVLKT